jgi:hypothetical protein
MKLYRRLRPNDTRPIDELKEEELDKLIVFWSR